MNETDKLITDQFNRLPKALQEALNTVPWKSSIKEIAVTNKIPLETVDVVERETMFILYGFENPDDYIENLKREAQIDEETATNIAEAVNERIFKEISQKMDQMAPQETKEQATERLTQRMRGETPQAVETVPANLPMVEPGQVAHEIPHDPKFDKLNKLNKEETKPPTENYGYPSGKDPYREPLE